MQISPIVKQEDTIDLTLSPPPKPPKIEPNMTVDSPEIDVVRMVTSTGGTRVSTAPVIKQEVKEEEGTDCVKTENPKMSFSDYLEATNTRVLSEQDTEYVNYVKKEAVDESEPVYDAEPISVSVKPKLAKPVYRSNAKKEGQKVVDEKKVVSVGVIENGDFEEEADWLLVGRTAITGLSTTKGRKLEDNEIVHFAFPNGDIRSNNKSGYWISAKAANAASGIVRFSTKRSGEVIDFI